MADEYRRRWADRRSSAPRSRVSRGAAPCLALALLTLGGLGILPRAGVAAEPPVPDAVIGGGTLRVIGGEAAGADQWPSIVALVREGSSSPADRQFCGGTVIAPRWVLTAAHCLYDIFLREIEPAELRVIAGVTDLRAGEVDEESVVTNLYVHPAYDHVAQNAYDDIALIELANEIDALPVALFAGDTEELGTGTAFVAGWGATEFTTPRRATYPDALHQAAVPLVPRAVCNDPLSYAGYVGEGQLCAGFREGGVDTCVGDSGGPLVINVGDRAEQVGVVSYGRGCAEPLFYGIYTNVSAYRGWIGEYVALEDPVVPVTVTEQPRGPSDVETPTPIASSPPVRPDGENPFEPIASGDDDAVPEGDDPSFLLGGGAVGPFAALALLLCGIGRRCRVAA